MGYWWTKLFIDLVKEAAWPIFFLILLLIIVPRYKMEIYGIFKFFASLIQKRGVKTPYVEIPPETDPGSKKEDVTPAAMGTEVDYKEDRARELAEQIAKTRIAEKEKIPELDVILGFYQEGKKNVPVLTTTLEVTYQPQYKDIDGVRYVIGQKVEFMVVNFSTTKVLKYPHVAVEFPSKFKHLDTAHPDRGNRTTNSNLWGMGGRLTQLEDKPSSGTTEISSIPKRQLEPGEGIRFFIRFELPNETKNYNLKMRSGDVSQDLTLRVKKLLRETVND